MSESVSVTTIISSVCFTIELTHFSSGMEFMQYVKNGERKGVLDVGVTHEQYGNDTRTDLQKEKMAPATSKYWEIHVAPPASFAPDDE